MAEVDGQWPSEDEDFDAVHDGKPVVASDSEPPQSTSVAVSEAEPEQTPVDNETAPEAPEPEAAPEVTSEAEPTEAAPQEQHEQAVPEPAEPAPAAPEPEAPQPEAPHEEAVPAVAKLPKAPGTKGSMLRNVLIVLLLAGLIGLGMWAMALQGENNDLKAQVKTLNQNPQIAIQKQTQELIASVGKLMDLPSGETPTIANVSDAEQAKKQSAFFNNAQNGDKVLMYVKSGQAILYRPSTDKIILVAPLTFNDSAAAGASNTD